MFLVFKSLGMTLAILIFGVALAFTASATDFQMPPSVGDGANESGKSKKSLVSKGTFRLLEDVQKSIDKGHTDLAFEKLNALILRVIDNPYESAVVLKTAAYLYVARDEAHKAIELMQVCLRMNQLAHSNQQKLRYDLAQLLLSANNYQGAIDQLMAWLNSAQPDDITPSIYIRLGSVYTQAGDHTEATKHFKKAIAINNKSHEYHHQLLLASYVSQGENGAAIGLLKNMLIKFPGKKKYFLQLVALYDQTEQSQQALSGLELAYQQGLLDQTEEIVSLAFRLLDKGYPFKAATLLQKEIDNFLVWRTPENLNLLAQAYINSQQIDRAIPILEKAIKTSSELNTTLTLAYLYMEDEAFNQAIETLNKALKIFEGKEAISLKLILAHAYVQNKELAKAEATYGALQGSPDLSNDQEKQVRDWLGFLAKKPS